MELIYYHIRHKFLPLPPSPFEHQIVWTKSKCCYTKYNKYVIIYDMYVWIAAYYNSCAVNVL